MLSKLGISRYLSADQPPLPPGRGALAFISAHIPEESGMTARFEAMVLELKEAGYRILCDIDAATPAQFGCRDEKEFLERYGLDILRLDDGYSHDQLLDLARELPVALNASTIPGAEKKELLAVNPEVLFVYNFYPKEETGLDRVTFDWFCQGVPAGNLAVFIPGDEQLRGPLHEGLVTLEEDRGQPPYTAFVRFQEMGIPQVLTADPGLSRSQQALIRMAQEGVYPIPCQLKDPGLYRIPFTIRLDSPVGLKRLQESRSYGKPGNRFVPDGTAKPRCRGDICQDNEGFGRYSGEITLVNDELPMRGRINTIGRIHPRYVRLLEHIRNGSRVMFVEESEFEEGTGK